jgi:hypothetical protein
MSHSLIGADRRTHIKIIAVALVSSIMLVMFGLIVRTDNSEIATARLHGPALKIGKSTTATAREGSTIR